MSLFTVVIVTQHPSPRRQHRERPLFPCLGGGAPRRALPPPGSGGSGRRARSAEGAAAPRACLGPAQPRFPRSIPAAERVTMTIGNACQARWLATAAGPFSKAESLSLAPPACGRFSHHSVPISVQTPQAPGAPWRSQRGRGAKAASPPPATASGEGEYRFPCRYPRGQPPALPNAIEGHIMWG